ncbi:M28 family metallopeptidase [Mesonia sp.]|uniref:M28 family metallopeptidase n=1 Tax=Mesonia sp. TaxID=1960830 RepID=UPI003F9ADFA0
MRKMIYLIALVAITACAQKPGTPSIDSSVKTENYEFQESDLKKSLQFFSSDELLGRNTGSEGIEAAATYAEEVFKDYNLKPYYTSYRDSFEVKDKTGYNVVAFKEGTDPQLKDEIIVLGAHYDHIGLQTESAKIINKDSIANGANDNAAGSVAILEMAKYFSSRDTKRSIMFVLFSAEELGLLGSTHLAKRLKKEDAPVYFMLNFEMIGVPLPHQDYLAYLTGFDNSTLAESFNQKTGKNTFGFFEKAKSFQLFKRSDNYPFYQELNVPAQTLCTFDFENYPYYHHVDDEIEFLDMKHMLHLLEEVATGVEALANENDKSIRLK